MKIEHREIPIREVAEGYSDNSEEGVVGFGGRLNIRPKYQREFVYREKERNAVIDTIRKGFPLNVMYWAVNGDSSLEVLDGQQRTISFCQYIIGDFSVDSKYFHSLTGTEKLKILDYPLMVYFCEGDDREKLDWFKTVNLAGVELTEQELRNAVYTGPWLTHAKSIFSKTNCAAYLLAKDYVVGSPIRQELLELALKWVSGGRVEKYMSKHQHDENAAELWEHFTDVMEWTGRTFPTYRREMKGVDWNHLHGLCGGRLFKQERVEELDAEIQRLMEDEDVKNKKGIYNYVLTGEERHLNIRVFSDSQKRTAFERQKGVCPKCERHFDLNDMQADHIMPWSKGGKTAPENCQMLCADCNRRKGAV